MTRRPLDILRRRFGDVVLLVLILTLAHQPFSVYGDPGPPEWVNYYGGDARLYGEPVPEGAVITAHGPQGVQCGQFTVKSAGKFGALPCLRDGDDGAEPGDRISFRVNGLPTTAVPLSLNGSPVDPSTPITWSGLGDLWEIKLEAPAPVGGYSMPARWMATLWTRKAMFAALGTGVTALALVAVVLTRKRR